MPSPSDTPVVPLAAISEPAFLYAPGGIVRAATPAAERLAGPDIVGLSGAELLRRLGATDPYGGTIAPAELPDCWALGGEDVPDRILRITAVDGTERTVIVSASPIVEGGRNAGALSIWRDITERVRAEEEMTESEADARSFMANMIDACAICETVRDDRGEPVDIRLVEVNPALARELCLPAEQIVGRTAYSILPFLPRSWFDLFLEVDRTRRPLVVEEPFPALGRWYHVTGFPVRRGRVAVVFRDITDRRRAEEALRESEAKYRRLVDDDITGDFISAPDGRLLDCNPAFARMFGFASVEEARSSSIVETYLQPEEREALLDCLRTERRLENDERFRRRRDGTPIHVVENIIGDFDADGTLREIRGYIIEDTQRYRAERSLLQRERTLRGIFRAAPVGIGMDSRRTITEANDQLGLMTDERWAEFYQMARDQGVYPADMDYRSAYTLDFVQPAQP